MPPRPASSARLERVEQVGLLDVEPFSARERDHVGVRVDSASLDAGVAEEREQLTAAAADVEHRRSVAEVVDVDPLTLADDVGRPAHAALEGEVVGQRIGARLRGDGHRRRALPALEAEHSLLELADEALALSSLRAHAVELLAERIDQLQSRVVERPLLLRQRLDVPAHRPPEGPLQEPGDGAAVRRPLRRDGPELLGSRAGASPDGERPAAVRAPAQLLAQARDERVEIEVAGVTSCRGRGFRVGRGHRGKL